MEEDQNQGKGHEGERGKRDKGWGKATESCDGPEKTFVLDCGRALGVGGCEDER